ncbi:MAG: CHAT domain-containing protein [Bacteroidetes bacterium]|nr:CHAT domain-containing protein [Bacteroidota bacterium]
MCRRGVFLLLALLVYASPEFGHPEPPLERAISLYRRADYLFHLNTATPATDSAALAGFDGVLELLQPLPAGKERDTLYPFSCLKKGILLDAAANYTPALTAYRKAMDYHPKDDSLSFVARVYAGAVYYNLNNFDSADYFLQKAESMAPAYRNPDDEVRLYNTLGVLYYDNGNYQQGRNYFGQALRLVEGKKPFDTVSAVHLQTNIATCFYRLDQYEEALALYKKMLGYRRELHFVYMNMGRTYAALGRYPEAMACFRLVDTKKVPAVWNEMAATQRQLLRLDSCLWYLDRLKKEEVNKMDLGVNQLYRADCYIDRKQYQEALGCLDESIHIFSGVHFRLFDALLKKAQVYELLEKPESAYEVYVKALSLLRYIEKSYDTDDAKLFLKKKSAGVYDGALNVCLRLKRVEQAFLISERSKATIVLANIRESTMGGDEKVLKEVRNIKYNLARINVRAEETTDSAAMRMIARDREEYGVRLARLQKQLEQNNAYYKLKYDDSEPGLRELQEQLGKNQALISFYVASGMVHTFILTRQTLSYDSVGRLQGDVEGWLEQLKITESGRKFKPGAVGERLYERLVRPIQAATAAQDEWIIVPDGFLYYLPFESLPAGANGDFLLKTTTISYRLSCRLLKAPEQGGNGQGILSFAPFAGAGGEFPRLPASQEEIASLSGAQYVDGRATKANFLKEINHYPIIHLATHAISSLTNSAGSYVAFYGNGADSRLYLEELYGLNLGATRLVIISACETGQGAIVGKEGVISLSRAFVYAGCASTINSLWKADDKATAFILKQFYVYLGKGYTKAKALQQAKLDYLVGNSIDKSPAYWAHLVLMGDEAPLYGNGFNWIWEVAAGVVLVAGIYLVWKFRKKKSAIFRT